MSGVVGDILQKTCEPSDISGVVGDIFLNLVKILIFWPPTGKMSCLKWFLTFLWALLTLKLYFCHLLKTYH